MSTPAFSTLVPLRHRTKTQAISAQLTELAHQLGPDAKLPTVLQLCAQLGVSVTTLNTVLAELESQKVIYRRHGVGIFVSPQLSQKCVGLVCAPNFFRAGTSPFWQQLIESVQARASSKNEAFRFYLSILPDQSEQVVPHDLREDVEARRVNGVLMVGGNKRMATWLHEHKIPAVSFAGDGQWNVRIDYAALLRAAVETLTARGCRELAVMMPRDVNDVNVLQRSVYFVDELKKRGMKIEPCWIWDAVGRFEENAAELPETHQEQGYRAVMDIFGPQRAIERWPQGLVISDDMMARGALIALGKLGVRPGIDLQIATHLNRNSAVLQGYENELNLIEIDPAAIVRAMFELLETLMDGQTPAATTAWVSPGPIELS